MTKSNKEITKKKIIKKKLRRIFRAENLLKVILFVATLAILATSILPYII